MSLFDHKDESGGDYMPTGRQTLRVCGTRRFQFNTGGPGFEIKLTNDDSTSKGLKAVKVGFSLKPTAQWKLAQFAQACGFSDADLQAWDEKNAATDRMFINRCVSVSLVKPDKYMEVEDFSWEKATDTPAGPSKPAALATPAAHSAPTPQGFPEPAMAAATADPEGDALPW